MPFAYSHRVRFSDTDAAGVVYFANVLSICHEAYEASLEAAGIDLKLFFSPSTPAIPIVHASVDFFHPFFCGDRLLIHLFPQICSESEFAVDYQVLINDKMGAKAKTRHVCIDPHARTRQSLPPELYHWIHLYPE